MALISIVTINYNSAKHSVACVDSILEHTAKEVDFEIIVVDNASSKDDYRFLVENISKDKRVKVVRSKINTGFGGGNMIGVQNSNNPKYLLFLNNDCSLTEDSISKIYNYIDDKPNIGLVGPRILNSNGEFKNGFGHIHSLLHSFIGGGRLYQKIYKKEDPRKDSKKVKEVDFVVGAFMFFRADVFNQIGCFDTNIFLYYEEMDICFRMKKAGFKTIYFPKTTYKHYEGASTHSANKWITIRKEQQISHNYFFRKSYSKLEYLIWYLITLIKFPFKVIRDPIIFPLFKLHLKGNSSKYSLKHKQEIVN